jgi:hypothetical protein
MEPRAGFGPATPALPRLSDIIDLNRFRGYLDSKYSHPYSVAKYNYAVRFLDCYQNPAKLLNVPETIRPNVLKALISISKFTGEYTAFKDSLRQHGIKWCKPDSFTAFLNIVNNNHDSLLEWYHNANAVLRDNERVFLKFALHSGLRKSEAIEAFNMIIQLSKDGKLCEYHDKELRCLCHFKYPSLFLRCTKNTYITPIDENSVNEIAQCEPVTYSAIRKRLNRKGLTLRIKECRSYYASFLRNHGVLSESIDLVQGRIGKSVFVRNYLKLNLQSLSNEILSKLEEIEETKAETLIQQ